jgi:hypothetical protein
MRWVQAIVLNICAIVVAAVFGAIVINGVTRVDGFPNGEVPLAPFYRCFVAIIVLAAVAPFATFRAKALTFSGLYVVELVLSVISTIIAITVVALFYDGDPSSAKPWTHLGAVTPFISGIVGYHLLRRSRSTGSDETIQLSADTF